MATSVGAVIRDREIVNDGFGRYGPIWLPDGFVERGRTLSSRKRDRAAIGREFGLWYGMWWAGSVDPDHGGGFLLMSVGSDPVTDPTCTGALAEARILK